MSDSCFIFEKKEIDTFDIELLIKKAQKYSDASCNT